MIPPASLILDVQAAQSREHGERGIARFVLEQSLALFEVADPAIHSFVMNPELPVVPRLQILKSTGKLRLNSPAGPGGSAPVGDRLLYHIMSPFELGHSLERIWPRYARNPRWLTVVTLYDLIPLIFRDKYLSGDSELASQYQARLRLVKNADLVLAISQATAADAVRLLALDPQRVATIGAGVSDFFRRSIDRDVAFREARKKLRELRSGFVFCLGGIDHRKNVDGLLQGYALLDPDLRAQHQLVITCKMNESGEAALRAIVRRLGIERDVVLTNYVSDEFLYCLYRSAHLFVLPSLYEGFGLPVIEAMTCGTSSIGSDRAALREVLPSPDFRFNPADPADIAQVMRRGLIDRGFRARLSEVAQRAAKMHTWPSVAASTKHALEELYTRRPGRLHFVARRKPRIAVFTPMPPQASGVADYSYQLVGEMAKLVDVDVYVEEDPRSLLPLKFANVRLRHHSAFPYFDALAPYADVVYCMGNSVFHGFVYEALHRRPGTVLSHDVQFTDFYAWYGGTRLRDPAWFPRAVVRQHGAALGKRAARGDLSLEERVAHDVHMVGELVELSTRFLVHSAYAADVVRRQRPDLSSRICVVPFAISDGRAVEARGEDQRLVASFGIAAPIKRLDLFLESAAIVARRMPGTRFAIVGALHPERYGDQLRRSASKLGIGDLVTFTGRVDRREYESWLSRTTCAVQLRLISHGESSAAVGDCLRHGVPTIVTAAGAQRDLPRGVALPVSPSSSPVQVAEQILSLLKNRREADALSKGALEFAARFSFSRTATAVLDASAGEPVDIASASPLIGEHRRLQGAGQNAR